ncbi:MAG TPA: FISUMP domain-containing protein [Bacteroidales bacterium]|nr:FISUMP domain-containing protein [Bacteroidales bacterium]HQK68407.1 FISUMP domain-containing protein [Bacteroidales bacterium]
MKLKVFSVLLLIFLSYAGLTAQDYMIDFTGTGESTTVGSVTVENMTQNKSIQIDGAQVLHLMGVVTAIETTQSGFDDKILLFPNPMRESARMSFTLPATDEVLITLYNLAGGKIFEKSEQLTKGEHTYNIEGVGDGLYFIRISSGAFLLSGKLIVSGSQGRDINIGLGNSELFQEKRSETKGESGVVVMQYTKGDLLKFTGTSGEYSTIITDVPESSKTITFNFVECSDGDGNDYPVVETGKGDEKCPQQFWMGANLKTTTYNDKTPIPLIMDNIIWGRLESEAYCWYDNKTYNKDIYGALYNWFVVNSGKLCPKGWHVPTDHDWTILTYYLDGNGVAGGKLKERGFSYWLSPNTGATNVSGFTARPGSFRKEDGAFHTPGDTGLWWSATINEVSNAWSRAMFYNNDDVKRTFHGFKSGLSVRCVKDN